MAQETSAGTWTRSHKLIKFDVAGDIKVPEKSSVSQSLMGQMMFCKYYEGFANTLIVKITCVDTNGLLDKLPIRTGMSVELSFSHASLDKEEVYEFSQANNTNLIIVNIDNGTHSDKRQMYTLTCITPTTLSNHTTRAYKRYGSNIGTTVGLLLSEVMGVPEDRMQKVENTANKYEFCANFTRPINLINRLATKSVSKGAKPDSAERGLCGFMFFETQKTGYNFRSVKDMMEKESPFPPYVKVGAKDALDSNPFTLSATPKFNESQDLIKKLRTGQFQSHNVVYDIMTRSLTDNIYKSETDGEVASTEVASTVDEIPSRRILNVLDRGSTTGKDGQLAEPVDKVVWRQSHAAAQYQLLYSQILNVTIPMNLNLEVGMTLNFKFPDLNTGEGTTPGVTPSSGKYLIARLSHEFGNPVGDFTGLTLVREHYQPYEE